MWEKKDDAGGIHDKAKTYTWSATFKVHHPDGTAFTVFLDTLNKKCDDDEATPCTTNADCAKAPDTYASNDLCGHAGYRDWRLPSVNKDGGALELDSLIDSTPTQGSNKIFPKFKTPCPAGCTVLHCSCNPPDFYWSSTTDHRSPPYAWLVHFTNGLLYTNVKTFNYRVRAVRTGS